MLGYYFASETSRETSYVRSCHKLKQSLPALAVSWPVCSICFSLCALASPAPVPPQLSTEMYDVNQEGDCYYEVCLRFMQNALDRWRELDVTHHLTVVFFCRTHFCSNKVSVQRNAGVEKAVNLCQVVFFKKLRGAIERVVRCGHVYIYLIRFFRVLSQWVPCALLVKHRGWNSSRRRPCVSPSRILHVTPTIQMY